MRLLINGKAVEPERLKAMCDEATLDFVPEGKCRGLAPNLFYPQRGEERAPAYAACAECPVSLECLAWALAHERSGIWGGLSARSRTDLRRRLRVACNAPEVEADPMGPVCGTDGGYSKHRRNNEDPCAACRSAHARRQTGWQKRRRGAVA